MRKLLGGLTLGLGLLASTAQADVARLYYGIGVADSIVELRDEDGTEDEDSLGTLNATLGLQLLDFVGLELEVGAASDQADSLFSEPMVQYQAAMLKLGFRWDRVGLYALGGRARFDLDDEFGETDEDSYPVVGGGINLFGNETTSLNLHVLSFDEGDFTTATVGFQHYFGGFR